MKKIELVPTPQVTLNFSVSDEMISDIKVCRRIAESRNTQRGNDCDFCSWDKCRLGDIVMCELLSLQDIEQLSAAAQVSSLPADGVQRAETTV